MDEVEWSYLPVHGVVYMPHYLPLLLIDPGKTFYWFLLEPNNYMGEISEMVKQIANNEI